MRILILLSALLVWHADVAGKWKVAAKTQSGRDIAATLILKSAEGALSGTLITEQGDEVPLVEMKLNDKAFSFKVPSDEGAFLVNVTVEDDVMKGTYKTPAGDSNEVTASRIK